MEQLAAVRPPRYYWSAVGPSSAAVVEDTAGTVDWGSRGELADSRTGTGAGMPWLKLGNGGLRGDKHSEAVYALM